MLGWQTSIAWAILFLAAHPSGRWKCCCSRTSWLLEIGLRISVRGVAWPRCHPIHTRSYTSLAPSPWMGSACTFPCPGLVGGIVQHCPEPAVVASKCCLPEPCPAWGIPLRPALAFHTGPRRPMWPCLNAERCGAPTWSMAGIASTIWSLWPHILRRSLTSSGTAPQGCLIGGGRLWWLTLRPPIWRGSWSTPVRWTAPLCPKWLSAGLRIGWPKCPGTPAESCPPLILEWPLPRASESSDPSLWARTSCPDPRGKNPQHPRGRGWICWRG